MITLILFFCIFFVSIPTLIYPPSHKIFRNKKSYAFAYGLSIIPIVVSAFMLLNFSLSVTEKVNSLIALSPITFLILYKIFDKLSIEEYGRHIYFSTKYSKDKESLESTWSEWFFQMLLLLNPFLWLGIGILIFK
jgi:hypothetical protein